MEQQGRDDHGGKAATPSARAAPPIGIRAAGTRTETDSMGAVEVPAARYWGAQTQRALQHFAVAGDRMPLEIHRAYALVKKAAARVNLAAGRLDARLAGAIEQAADEALAGRLDSEFVSPLWQSGSGTQTHMNVNEVLANRASQILGGTPGSRHPVHPNDHVNLGQSSNDTFVTALHIAALLAVERRLAPAAEALIREVERKAAEWMDVVKIGRTHLQDATPLTVGQEWSGYAQQLRDALARIEQARHGLHELAVGGTAVGTGLNAPPGFGRDMARALAELSGLPLVSAPNKFAAQASLDAPVAMMAALRGLAVALIKLANDLRWLASGPRCGLGELVLPAGEPGSSIMPGKVNPSQCESMIMVCTQVLGLDAAVAFAGSQGHFELQTMRPLVAGNLLHALDMLGDACANLHRHAVAGTRLNRARIDELLERSLMLVTALSPVIGYDQAAAIAHLAHEQGLSLRDAALRSGLVDARTFDSVVRADAMVGRGTAGA